MDEGRRKMDDGRKEDGQNQNREGSESLSQGLRLCHGDFFHCKYIDEETFQRLDDGYEHIFAMLNAMENKVDSFCRPASYRSGLPSSIGLSQTSNLKRSVPLTAGGH